MSMPFYPFEQFAFVIKEIVCEYFEIQRQTLLFHFLQKETRNTIQFSMSLRFYKCIADKIAN